MNGVSIIETATLEALIHEVRGLRETVVTTISELKDTKKPYLTTQEVMELTGFSIDWVNDHKADIGFSNIGRTIRFKRKDVEAYMDAGYFKKSQRRKSR